MRIPALARLAIATTLLGCSTAMPTDPTIGLENARDVVTVDGTALTLETYLWRDFQPISPPDGKNLIAVLRVRGSGGVTVPRTVRADSAWVTFGSEVWATAVAEEAPRAPNDPVYQVVARNGPKWGPGVTVTVVLRLRGATGEAVLLRAPNQPIFRTD